MRDLWQELRSKGFTSDQCSEVSEWAEQLVSEETTKVEEEKKELLDCIHNFMGFFDTPVARMKMPSDDSEAVRQIGRDIMKKYNINYRGI